MGVRKLQTQGVHDITLVGIAPVHLADAIERLVATSTGSLSEDRSPQDPFGRPAG